jgi:polyferredoxin
MTRTILTYGLISGLVAILGIIGTIVAPGDGHHSVWLGYLIMLVALSAILIGVKQHRDRALGGVIKFWPAFLVGLGIALIAGLAYVAVWEIYLAMTH